MSKVRLSPRALADIDEIADYSIDTFGARSMESYVQGIYDLFEKLATHPEMGPIARSRHPRMRRYTFRQHVIFYQPGPNGILVWRIHPMVRLRSSGELPD